MTLAAHSLLNRSGRTLTPATLPLYPCAATAGRRRGRLLERLLLRRPLPRPVPRPSFQAQARVPPPSLGPGPPPPPPPEGGGRSSLGPHLFQSPHPHHSFDLGGGLTPSLAPIAGPVQPPLRILGRVCFGIASSVSCGCFPPLGWDAPLSSPHAVSWMGGAGAPPTPHAARRTPHAARRTPHAARLRSMVCIRHGTVPSSGTPPYHCRRPSDGGGLRQRRRGTAAAHRHHR